MNRVLHLETTAAVCSVALSEDDRLVQLLEHEEPNAHSRVLLSLINQLLLESGWSRNQLDAVALSAGPGSYTGLHVGRVTGRWDTKVYIIPQVGFGTCCITIYSKVEENRSFRVAV